MRRQPLPRRSPWIRRATETKRRTARGWNWPYIWLLPVGAILHPVPRKLRIEPLEHFPIIRELVIDQTDFLNKLDAVKPYLIPREDLPLSAGPHRQTPAQMDKYYAYSQCINCLLCYGACPQYGLNSTFTGPAALALMHRYNADSRDQGWTARSDIANAEEGVWGCTLVGYCSEVCPKSVDPAHAINLNKVNSATDYFKDLAAQLKKRITS